jgi:hypothetical protein
MGFEESVWVRPKGGKYGEDIYVSTHVDDCLISCKSTATMSKFKQELLNRSQGTDEGEVREYLGCEVIRDRAARTGKHVQAGYAERVLRTFGMWDCNPVLTPLDPNVRLTKWDSPEVVDPRLHRRMRSIVGCLSYHCGMSLIEEHCGMSLIWSTSTGFGIHILSIKQVRSIPWSCTISGCRASSCVSPRDLQRRHHVLRSLRRAS